MFATGVTIRETLGNGFVTRVDLLDLNGVYHTAWTGVDPSTPGAARDFAIDFAQTSYLVRGVKVYVNTNASSTWEETDAIQLRGSAVCNTAKRLRPALASITTKRAAPPKTGAVMKNTGN